MYKLIRQILFCFPPEPVHHFSMQVLKIVASTKVGQVVLKKLYAPKRERAVQLAGLNFKNPVGLAAGFDKNACYLKELALLGFGHVEIGTVTPLAQSGNDQPRLFRLPKDKAIINRMGFNNDGATEITNQLRKYRKNYPKNDMLIGGNIGKNKLTPNENAWQDYLICFDALHEVVDYFVVNVSSPNTPGLRALQDKDALKEILKTLQNRNAEKPRHRPIFLKIAPDLEREQVDDVIALAHEINLEGLVISNTTIDRTGLLTNKNKVEAIGAGGLSGKPVLKKSTELLKYVAEKTAGKIPIIASGGIFSAYDANEKIKAGASLVQVWTGFIYEGPGIVKSICQHC
jgi:dihydroorotate dehydrogenase